MSRIAIVLLGTVAAALFLPSVTTARAAEAKRPNILLIVADDKY